MFILNKLKKRIHAVISKSRNLKVKNFKDSCAGIKSLKLKSPKVQ